MKNTITHPVITHLIYTIAFIAIWSFLGQGYGHWFIGIAIWFLSAAALITARFYFYARKNS